MIWIDKKGVRHSDYHASCVTCAICMDCKHFKAMGNMKPICSAFPQGIPEAVWTGTLLHTMPISGDHGLQYEKAEDVYKRQPPSCHDHSDTAFQK